MAGNRRWTKTEIEVLTKEYGNEDVKFLSKKLKRSIDSIHWKASQLNIDFKRNDYGDLLRRMESIENKLDLLMELEFSKENTKLTSYQLMFLRENYYSMSLEKLSEEMNLSIYKIRTAVRSLINRGVLLKKYGYKGYNIDMF